MCSAQAHVCFGPYADITLWPAHHFGWLFQQGKALALAAHIWVSRRENAEWVVLKQPGMQVVVHVLLWNERFVPLHWTQGGLPKERGALSGVRR
jgi:hypothetical protein